MLQDQLVMKAVKVFSLFGILCVVDLYVCLLEKFANSSADSISHQNILS